MSQAENDTLGRDSDGKFAKGQSGNPSGRAKMPAEIRDILSSNSEKAVKAIVKFMDDDDPRVALRAAEALLDRTYGKPQLMAETISFSVPDDCNDAGALLALHASLLRATAKGEVAVSEAREMSALFESHRRLIEVADLESRIAKLESSQRN